MTEVIQEPRVGIKDLIHIGLEHRSIPIVSTKEILRRLERKDRLVILDVRTSMEYSWGHIPGAISLPLSEIQEGRINPDIKPDDEIIVHCHSGFRSKLAAKILYTKGYKNVKDMPGGIYDWNKINGPTTET